MFLGEGGERGRGNREIPSFINAEGMKEGYRNDKIFGKKDNLKPVIILKRREW